MTLSLFYSLRESTSCPEMRLSSAIMQVSWIRDAFKVLLSFFIVAECSTKSSSIVSDWLPWFLRYLVVKFFMNDKATSLERSTLRLITLSWRSISKVWLKALAVMGGLPFPNISFFYSISSRSSAISQFFLFYWFSISYSKRFKNCCGLAESAYSTSNLSTSCQSVAFMRYLTLSRTRSRVSSDKFLAKYLSRSLCSRYNSNSYSSYSILVTCCFRAMLCISFWREINLLIWAF